MWEAGAKASDPALGPGVYATPCVAPSEREQCEAQAPSHQESGPVGAAPSVPAQPPGAPLSAPPLSELASALQRQLSAALGHSAGSALCMQLSDRVARLVTACAAHARLARPQHRLRLRQLQERLDSHAVQLRSAARSDTDHLFTELSLDVAQLLQLVHS